MIATLRARVLSDAGLYAALFLLLAAQTAAGSAQHAHDAFVLFGQGDPHWLPWTLAGTPELVALAATLELRGRRKAHGADVDVRVPVAILVGAVLVLVAAQLVTAQRTAFGMFAAAWPALAFLAAVVLVETRPRAATPAGSAKPARTPRPKTSGATASSERSVQETAPEPDRGDGQPDGIPADIPAALAALDDTARAVYAALEAAGPGETLTPEQIRTRTGLDRGRGYRATKALLAADLVVAAQPGRYAARKIEAVA